jgi:phospholipid N-methyltransferase
VGLVGSEMNTITKEWETKNRGLDELPCNYDFIVSTTEFRKFLIYPFNLNTYIMHNEITLMRSFVDPWEKEILEIGAGFGNFCRCLYDRALIKNYTILDTKSMLRFSKSFLSHYNIPCSFVDSENYKSLSKREFDLVISNVCLSEIPPDFRENLVNVVFPNCDAVFMIDSGYVGFSTWLEEKINKFFSEVCFLEIPDLITAQKNQRVFSGNK